ncbi:hypothetical protein WK13_12370 [Burkholderia ubonensis]|nr:hypothetical protein WK13_12370 [Burkholderia ubonensis]
MYDGFGIWLAARCLNKGRFIWTNEEHAIATAMKMRCFQCTTHVCAATSCWADIGLIVVRQA